MRPAALLLIAAAMRLGAQSPDVIYDEARVPQYTLPDVLGSVKDRASWKKQRVRLLELYRREVFGRSPEKSPALAWEAGATDRQALGGRAVRKIVTLYFGGKNATPRARLLMYLPAAAIRPAPVILGLSFAPIQTVANDPGVPLGDEWIRNVKQPGQEKSRGAQAQQWQVDQILAHGYGLAVMYYGDIEPDFDGGIKYGVRPLFFKPGQTEPSADEWGAISAWAWGLRRAMDYLETDPSVDAKRVAVFGHSRLGKTAIWAGAQDARFSLVIANESGEGGAAISRRDYGERIQDLNTRFPHWFCLNFRKYNGQEDQMPFDSHMLLALIAPRALYVGSAEGDRWSDPRGEFLGAYYASKVWELLGKKGLTSDVMPPVEHPVMGESVAYHIRTGKHDVTAYDWQQYLAFADRQWGSIP
jgi:hypothetical protein